MYTLSIASAIKKMTVNEALSLKTIIDKLIFNRKQLLFNETSEKGDLQLLAIVCN